MLLLYFVATVSFIIVSSLYHLWNRKHMKISNLKIMLCGTASSKPQKTKFKRRLYKLTTKLLQNYHKSITKLQQTYYEAITSLSQIFHKLITNLRKLKWPSNARFIHHANVFVTHFTNKNKIAHEKTKIRR